MKWLILIHVLSAIIGVGPTFFMHVLIRKNLSFEELKYRLKMAKSLEYFPKIGGTIAVLSGLALYFIGNYGSFMKLWLLGSLILYILIQVTVIGFVGPRMQKVAEWVMNPANGEAKEIPEDLKRSYNQVHDLLYLASGMGTLLFIFMILKP